MRPAGIKTGSIVEAVVLLVLLVVVKLYTEHHERTDPSAVHLLEAAEQWCYDRNAETPIRPSEDRLLPYPASTRYTSVWRVKLKDEGNLAAPRGVAGDAVAVARRQRCIDITKTDSVVYPYTGTVEVVNVGHVWDPRTQDWGEGFCNYDMFITFRFNEGSWELVPQDTSR